jgi:hypothetical protein
MLLCWFHISSRQHDPISAKLIACETKEWIVMIRWMLTGKGHDPHKARMAKKLHPSNFTPGGKTMGKPGAAAEVKKHVESRSRAEPPQSVAMERHWDAESTGSNTEECEHCEQLKRAMPPLDMKRASVTTVKRIKTSGHRDTTFTPKTKIPGQQFTHSPSDPEQHWEAESFESHTGHSALKPPLYSKAKQITKDLMSSSVMSTNPPRRSTTRRGSKDITRKADNPKLHVGSGRKKNADTFINFLQVVKNPRQGENLFEVGAVWNSELQCTLEGVQSLLIKESYLTSSSKEICEYVTGAFQLLKVT